MRWGAVVCAVALTFSGCGGPTDDDIVAAQRTLTAYGHAYAVQDGDTACRLLTDDMRKRYERRGETCPEAFARTTSSDQRELRLKRAAVSGKQDGGLRGVVEFSESDGPGYGGEVRIAESGDRWLLDEDLSCVTPGCDP